MNILKNYQKASIIDENEWKASNFVLSITNIWHIESVLDITSDEAQEKKERGHFTDNHIFSHLLQ